MSSGWCFFQVDWAGLQSPALEFDKNCTKTLIFFKKLLFAFLNPKIVKRLKTLPKHRQTLVHYNAHTWAEIHYHISRAYWEKKKLKSGYSELRFSVYMYFAKPFLNFIDDTMIRYLNSKSYFNLFCAKEFWNLNSMVTWCTGWRRLLALIIFQRSSLK